jgi:hypothetical protein
MKHIFYFIGICFIIHEVLWLVNPVEYTEKSKKLKELMKQNKGKKWDTYSEDYKDILISRGLPSLLFTLWFFAGLLTFNWVAFIAIIAFNFIAIAPISKLFKFSPAYTILHWLNSVIGLAFGVFVIINSYHLKLNLYEIVKAWLF